MSIKGAVEMAMVAFGRLGESMKVQYDVIRERLLDIGRAT